MRGLGGKDVPLRRSPTQEPAPEPAVLQRRSLATAVAPAAALYGRPFINAVFELFRCRVRARCSQLSRLSPPEPQLSDFRWSGQIRADSAREKLILVTLISNSIQPAIAKDEFCRHSANPCPPHRAPLPAGHRPLQGPD
jgi:hypothetical protein